MTQLQIENKYNKSLILENIKIDIQSNETLLTTLVQSFDQWIKSYFQGNTWDSKTNRLLSISEEDKQTYSLNLITSLVLNNEQTLQSLSTSVCESTDISLVQTTMEWISYLNTFSLIRDNLLEIIKPKRLSGETFKVISKLSLDHNTISNLTKCIYLPPLVQLPDTYTTNTDGGYLTQHKHVILGHHTNRHNNPINLNVINNLQKIGYVIHNTPISSRIKPEKMSDTLFEVFQSTTDSLISNELKDREFYFTYAFDKRGRVYDRGYHIHIQGDETNKSQLDFSREVKVTPRGMEWLKIDLANHYGLDKKTWDERISWVNENIDKLEDLISSADKPLLFKQAVTNFRYTQATGYSRQIVRLDATCSGPQIMSVLTKDVEAMRMFNVIGSDRVRDFYTEAANKMFELMPNSILFNEWKSKGELRKYIKKGLMTFFYNSKAKIEELIPSDEYPEEHKCFYNVCEMLCKGACELKSDFNEIFSEDMNLFKWRLPDGHTSYVPNMVKRSKRLEIQELGSKVTFEYREQGPDKENTSDNKNWRSLAVNVIHSVDAWVCREVINKLSSKDINVSPIHDSFGVHCNHCDELREVYRDCLVRLYESNISNDIAKDILNSNEDILEYNEVNPEITELIRSNTNGYYIC